MTGGRGREPGAVHEAGAVAVFVAVVPVAALLLVGGEGARVVGGSER